MNIRPATLADTEKIARTHKASIRGLCQGSYCAEDIEKWTAILSPGIYEPAIREKIMVVAEEQDEIKGLGILDLKNAELSAVYIHPDSAGRGIGKRIVSELERVAGENGIRRLTLGATINAVGFYKRRGYVEDGKTSHELPNGARLECVKMHKELAAII